MKLYIWLFILLQDFVKNSFQFGYTKTEQLKWRQEHESCTGHIQSPIFINSFEAIPIGMPSLEFIGYHNLLPKYLKLENNGHSIALSISKENDIKQFDESETPYIFGAMLEDEYQFEGLHFHWGDKNNRGSEHVLNDLRYPLEMHLVHRNKKYNTVEKAMKYKDGLAVLAVFFQLRERKFKPLDILLQQIPSIINDKSQVYLNQTLKLNSLLPSDLETLYSYKGSLTTPPCSEAVTWILFPEPILISFEQMELFRHLKDKYQMKLVDNFRDLQPIGRRKVFLRKPEWKNSAHFYNGNFLKWIWFY